MLLNIFSDEVLFSVKDDTTNMLTGFLPMVGREYSGQLMVVGRAVNGWDDGISPAQLKDETARLEYGKEILKSVTENMGADCPMLWVTKPPKTEKDYNANKSAFWRVIKTVVGRLKIADVKNEPINWPSHLVWSNLYKIAPSTGGNPNTSLRRAQFEACKKLFYWEVEKYAPKRILFLSGWDWVEPFLVEAWQDKVLTPEKSFVEASGHIKFGSHIASCVVARHPQGNNETAWVDEVISAFG